jgi:hypothetical protein
MVDRRITRALKFPAFFLLIFSCIEPYTFVIPDNSPALVVEGYISDKSFNDTREYPSDGRYFSVRLTRTADVTNVQGTPVKDASVTLISDVNEEWAYQHSPAEPGLYQLYDSSFKAIPGTEYKIQILTEDEVYESSWAAIPETKVAPIGAVSFRETESQKYLIEAGENVVRTIEEIEAYISLRPNTSGNRINYRWKFTPMWVYVAPLSPSATRPGHTCWVTSKDYMKNFALQVDQSGSYDKPLFRLPTLRNERLLDDFSVLVEQFAMDEENYFFWKEMYDQNEGNVLVDKPPFNLRSNIFSLSGEKKAVGFFGVYQEQATRWYFNVSQLSYRVENTFKKGCETSYGPPVRGDCPEEPTPAFAACECKYCLRYSKGEATNVKPSWWRQ